MGGLAKTMPVTAVSFGLCSLSLMGIPPFGGFFAKYMIIAGAVSSPWIASAFILGAFLTILYLIRLFTLVFLGETKLAHAAREGTATMVWSVAILAALSLIAGFLIQYPSNFIQIALGQMVGRL
jgi:NADH:ubiquinone oxidoreductase subunit 5 (subunit L)/multisubunit Na+/H+ antiporter MnhA subunit